MRDDRRVRERGGTFQHLESHKRKGREVKEREKKEMEWNGREGKGSEGKGKEGNGMEGKGREGKGKKKLFLKNASVGIWGGPVLCVLLTVSIGMSVWLCMNGIFVKRMYFTSLA